MRIRTRGMLIIITQGLTQAMTIALGIALVRLVSKEIFGTFQQVFLVYFFISGIVSLQLESSLYYFIPKLEMSRRRALLFQTFLVSTLSAAVIGSVMFFMSEDIARALNNMALVPLVRIFAMYPFAERVLLLVPAYMISMGKNLRSGVYTLSAALLRFFAVIVLSSSGFGLTTVFTALVLVAWIIAAVGVLDMLRLSPDGRFALDRELMRQQFSFCLPLLATAVIGTASLQLDKLLVTTFFSPAIYAVYSVGAIELPIVSLVTLSLSSAIMPNLVQLMQQNKKFEALNIWQEAARKACLVIFPCFVFFFLAGRDIIVLLYHESYAMAAIPFRIYLCALPIRIVIYASLFRALGRTKPIVLGAVLSMVINTVVGFSFIILGKNSILGFAGPAVGTVVSYLGVGTLMLVLLSRTLEIRFGKIMRWKELGSIFLMSVLAGVISFTIPVPTVPLLYKLLAQGVIYAVVFIGIMIFSNRLKDDEKDLLIFPFRFLQAKLIFCCQRLTGTVNETEKQS